MDKTRLKQILEAALLAAGRPLTIADFESLFSHEREAPAREDIRTALGELATDWESGSLALQQVASGYRAQVRSEFEPWLAHLWDEKPPRYSRALLETLAIIAYRQPITRPEIEDIRGVSISTQIMRTLQEREWVRVVGHRDAPGKPAMYGTTRQFLDYFNLRSLDQLPPVAEIRDLESQFPELALEGKPQSGGDKSSPVDPVSTAVEPETPEAETPEVAPPGPAVAGIDADADAGEEPSSCESGEEGASPADISGPGRD